MGWRAAAVVVELLELVPVHLHFLDAALVVLATARGAEEEVPDTFAANTGTDFVKLDKLTPPPMASSSIEGLPLALVEITVAAIPELAEARSEGCNDFVRGVGPLLAPPEDADDDVAASTTPWMLKGSLRDAAVDSAEDGCCPDSKNATQQ